MKLNFCVLCGSTENLEHHHVIPLSLGGSNEEDNIITLCAKHHVQVHNLNDSRIHASALIKAAKEKNRKMGKFLGGRSPFGYKIVDGFLVKDEKKYPILKKIQLLKERGMSLEQIRKWLEETHDVSLTKMGIGDVLRRNNNDG